MWFLEFLLGVYLACLLFYPRVRRSTWWVIKSLCRIMRKVIKFSIRLFVKSKPVPIPPTVKVIPTQKRIKSEGAEPTLLDKAHPVIPGGPKGIMVDDAVLKQILNNPDIKVSEK